MRFLPVVPMLLAILLSTSPVFATDAVIGEEVTFESYNGEVERCVRVVPMPGAVFSPGDLEIEAGLCAMDLYDRVIGLCPKIWSTSPSIVLHDLVGSDFEKKRAKFQDKVCPGGKVAKYVSNGEMARLKFTMNQETTSAAYVPAPILYYNLSRYLQTEVGVAAAVWRTVDAQVLYNEVAFDGAKLTRDTGHLTKVHSAWQTIVDMIDDPESYARVGAYGTSADLLTASGTQVYGVLLNAQGGGYGPEMNSLEPEPSDEVLQRELWQKTAAFIGLSTAGSLDDSFEAARAGAVPPLTETMPDGVSDEQLLFWMREMSEIVLLDDMLAQQDRPGNIDMEERYYWVENGTVESAVADDSEPGDGVVPVHAMLIVRSIINDNDAAARTEYDNQNKISGSTAKLRHLDGGTYQRVQALATDIRAEGPILTWLNTSVGLEADQVEMIAGNILRVAETLAQSCAAGDLSFDLDPMGYFLAGQVLPADIPCAAE